VFKFTNWFRKSYNKPHLKRILAKSKMMSH